MQDAAGLAVEQGQANIASAGFSERWRRALKSKYYPNPGGDPAALMFHSFPFAGVFERGAHISGRPLLWLPTGAVAAHSPRQYAGRLVSVNVAGKPPLLFDADRRELGPLFFGISEVTIPKKFNLEAIFARAAERMLEFYQKRIKG